MAIYIWFRLFMFIDIFFAFNTYIMEVFRQSESFVKLYFLGTVCYVIKHIKYIQWMWKYYVSLYDIFYIKLCIYMCFTWRMCAFLVRWSKMFYCRTGNFLFCFILSAKSKQSLVPDVLTKFKCMRSRKIREIWILSVIVWRW